MKRSWLHVSNLLVRDTPEPIPLKSNPHVHPLIQLQDNNNVSGTASRLSFSRDLLQPALFQSQEKESTLELLAEGKLFRFYYQLRLMLKSLTKGFWCLQCLRPL